MCGLLVLGGSWQQAGLVVAGRRTGLEVTVLDRDPAAAARALADHFLAVDVSDVDACLDVARRLRPIGVVTTGTDWAVPSIAAIGEDLGLPTISRRAAHILTDKQLQLDVADAAGVARPRSAQFTDGSGTVPTPPTRSGRLVVKPVDASGSRGVSIVDGGTPTAQQIGAALAASPSGRACVQELVEGIELGCQALVDGHAVLACWPHNDQMSGTQPPGPVGHSMPLSLGARVETAVREAVDRLVAALPPFPGALNFDFIVDGDEVNLIEVAGRFGGGCLPRLVELSTGVPVHAALVDLAIGRAPRLESDGAVPVAARLLFGELEAAPSGPPPSARGLLEIVPHIGAGAAGSGGTHAGHALATVYGTAQNVAAAEQLVDSGSTWVTRQMSSSGRRKV